MADQKFTEKDVEKLNKAFADSNDEVKNLYDQLMDVFDVSKRINDSYKKTVDRIGDVNKAIDKSKAAISAHRFAIEQNEKTFKNIGKQLESNKDRLEEINAIEKKAASDKKLLENTNNNIVKSMQTLARISGDLGKQSEIREKLTADATNNANSQLDASKRLLELNKIIADVDSGWLGSGREREDLLKEQVELSELQNKLKVKGLSLDKQFVQSEQITNDLMVEKQHLLDRKNKQQSTAIETQMRLNEYESQSNELLTEKFKLQRDNLDIEKQQVEIKKDTKKRAEGIATLESRINNLYNIRSKLLMQLNFWKLVQLGYERFVALDKAAEDFRRSTGFSNTQMVELRKNAESINVEFQDMGIGINEVYTSAKALTDVFGRTSLVSKEAMQNVALMSANLGVAEADSANVLATFQGLGGATQEAAMNVMKMGANLSEKAGIPFKLVMNDIASASEQTLSMLGANPSKLMKASIAARTLGTSMNSIVSSQRKLLDFSSSMNDELELSALLGKSISFQKARQLAYEGDVAGAAKATLDTVKKAGDFNKMSVYQRESLAKASGMELKDLTKMLAVDAQKQEIKLRGTDEQKKQLALQEEALKTLEEEADLSKKGLLDQNESAIRQQKMQGQMTKLKNIMESLIVSIGDILEPVITALSDVVVPMFKLVAAILKVSIIPLFKLMAFPIQELGKKIQQISGTLDKWGTSISGTKDKFKDFFKFFESGTGYWIKMAAGTGLLYALFAGKMGFGAVTKGISSSFGMLKGGLSKIPGLGGLGGGGGAIGKVGNIAKSAKGGGFGESLGKGIASFMKYVAKGIGYFGSGSVLKGALGIALVGASIIPFAFAMKMFSDVDWKKAGTGLLVLGALTLAAAALSFIAPYIIAGSVAIGILGLALIPFGIAAIAAGYGVKLFSEAISNSVDPILRLSQIDLTKTALGIGAVGVALAAFGAGSAAAGLGSFVGGLLGGDPIKKMERLGAVGEKLKMTAEAISEISNVMSTFTVVDSFAKSIDTLSNSLSNLNDQVEKISVLKLAAITAIGAVGAATSAAPAAATTLNTSGIEAKLDTLTNLLTGGAVRVYLDGKDVSSAMSGIGR